MFFFLIRVWSEHNEGSVQDRSYVSDGITSVVYNVINILYRDRCF